MVDQMIFFQYIRESSQRSFPARQAPRSAPPKRPAKQEPAPPSQQTPQQAQTSATTPAPRGTITTKTYWEARSRCGRMSRSTRGPRGRPDAQVTRDVRD